MLVVHPWQEGVNKYLNPQKKPLLFVGAFLFPEKSRVIIQNMKKMLIYLFLINILFSQKELKIEGYDHMPLHTKFLWGKSGLLRKLNIAP